MRAWSTDLAAACVEALLDLLDGFGRVRPRAYLATALVVLAVTMFAAMGPHL